MEIRLGRARRVDKDPEIRSEHGPKSALLASPEIAEEGVPTKSEKAGNDEREMASGDVSADVPAWLEEAAESAFLAEKIPQESVAMPPPRAEAEQRGEEIFAPLPSLESLVSRIPTETREAVEELFRARFVSVRKFPIKALKTI